MARQFMKLYCDILPRKDLTPAAKIVYTVIVDAMRDKGVAWPGFRSVATDTGLSTSTVARLVVRLEALGLLVVERDSKGRPNRYTLPLTTVPKIGTGVPVDGTVSDPQSAPILDDTVPILDGGVPKIGTEAHPKSVRIQTRQQKQKKKQIKAPTFSWKEIQPNVKGTCLDTPEFAETWAAWVAHRREIRKPLTATTVTRQLKRLKEYGVDLATRTIEHSIEQGYQGFDQLWLTANKAPGSGAPADRPGRVRCTNGRYDNIGKILE